MAKKQEDQDYYQQATQNEFVFKELVKAVRPDIFVLMDQLDMTHVNYVALFHVIRYIENIATGSKYGEVKVIIQNGIVTFVQGDESTRLNEPALKLPVDIVN